MTDKPASYFESILLTLYPCKVPFHLRVHHTKPRHQCGSYWSHNRHIVINDKADSWDTRKCTETAIHEYAHHLHYTEFGKEERHQKSHSPEFWMIYGQLMSRAKALGIFEDDSIPVVDFGTGDKI